MQPRGLNDVSGQRQRLGRPDLPDLDAVPVPEHRLRQRLDEPRALAVEGQEAAGSGSAIATSAARAPPSSIFRAMP